MIADNVIVTNRHVARLFAEKKNGGFSFSTSPENREIRARIDFKEEYRQNACFEASVDKIEFVAEDTSSAPDIAFLHLQKNPNLPPPIPVVTTDAKPEYIAAIGYPARDPRNEEDAMVKVFGDIYNVKRLSPGCITTMIKTDYFFMHDCSTLGGNSGSAIIDIGSGEAIGLHFGGTFKRGNYAVKAGVLLNKLAELNIQVAVPAMPAEAPPVGIEEAKRPVSYYAGLKGYDPRFLGPALDVPLPTSAAGQQLSQVLDYTHFSVQMNMDRKMAAYTAVNINGKRLLWLARGGEKWYMDPRVADQAGPELYSNNDLDRGHLVRRLDPVWGSDAEAEKANEDTFHYTNACPQHKDLNQKYWNDLEDYILDNAGASDLKVTVFTGPIFRPDDRDYRGYKLPREFWKVVAMVRKHDGKKALSATAYLLSQANLLTDLEFVYGQFRTYQVPVSHIQTLTGLDFGNLVDFDPKEGIEEAVVKFQELKHLSDIRL
jgi:endonuclease G